MQPPYGYGTAPGVPQVPPPSYTPKLVLGLVAVGFFGLQLLATWLIHLIDVVALDAIRAGQITDWVRGGEAMLSSAASMMRLGGVIMFCVWIHGAASNVRALGRTGMTITPGWAVGWFFVPIASLYMPYRAMSEITTCSDPRDVPMAPTSITVWWALFLGSNFVRIFATLLRGTVDIGMHLGINVVATALSTGALVSLGTIILTIHRGQEQLRRSMHATS